MKWSNMRSVTVSIFWGASVVYSAINIDGTQAVQPATGNDPSPISDPTAYIPDQHDCPLACVDVSNVHSWIPYLSVRRLARCQEPMLLQFSITQPLDDPASNILIRSCTLGSASTAAQSNDTVLAENPKKSTGLYQPGLDTAAACTATGVEVQDKLQLSITSGGNGNADQLTSLLDGMQQYFDHADNCNENFLFAYHQQTVAAVYIGSSLGKSTVESALKALTGSLESDGPVANHTVAQLCGSDRQPERVFGVVIDTTGDLAAVQKTALGWSKGTCAANVDFKTAAELSEAKVFDISAGGKGTFGSNGTLTGNTTSFASRFRARVRDAGNPIAKRDTCRYIQVISGDDCGSLESRCDISDADFTKFNPSPTLCSSLAVDDYVCCSAGDPYTVPKPQPGSDGVCATYLIQNNDSCESLAKLYGLTTDDIEGFNQGKTWAWTACKDMLAGYSMCLSDGTAPLPPSQEGAECGPLVPGTLAPPAGTSLADLNPCPLKACCSNWGFCGVFPAHCDIHAPEGGGPGTKLPGFENTCVSNCGNDILQNSGPPTDFQRIGYYESYNLERDCLLLKAENANTDGSYTHIHWSFLEIDSTTWKPKIIDTKDQWGGFKNLTGVKRIASFGGWSYSTDAATYNIMRQAIITNRDTFAANIAQFVQDEGIDGIDIDWEYPGAPDILVDGVPIGQKTDGSDYLSFLTQLKTNLGTDKSVSIAAPASFWYLKAFPIDKIAAVIDYIVYMTYDLHGQWDYGNVNAFDQCDSGKCIRSQVNLTETHNSLSIITKAGVPNNKIFVGEASYGRSFHMAVDGCWGPLCDFTGTRTQSDAAPGRCTKTGGYMGLAELNEIIKQGDGAQFLHDDDSDTDIILYKGDAISYMTPTTKDTRRASWKDLNFAGSIDWAVDLQSFTSDDFDTAPDRPDTDLGDACVSGEDNGANSGNLCEFSCSLGFCPESLCTCTETGPLESLPQEKTGVDVVAWDEFDVDLNRLCKFACKCDNYCPEETCTTPVVDEDEPLQYGEGPYSVDYAAIDAENNAKCFLYNDPSYRDVSTFQCLSPCTPILNEAAEEGRTSNYGCMGYYPLDAPIPWDDSLGSVAMAPGICVCDNYLLNFIADTFIEALPIIAEIGCYILMSSLKLVLDIGADFIPGVGKALDAGLDMAAVAAQTAAYAYPDEEDPEGAFSWWLSPCGGTTLVPDDIKNLFGILSTLADGVSSFKTPTKLKKGGGKKGDDGNPTDQSKGRPTTGSGNGNSGSGNGVTKRPKKCKIPAGKDVTRLGPARNTLRSQSCVGSTTEKNEMVITSLVYAAGASATAIRPNCPAQYSQACFHYSSAIREHPQWSTLTCPDAAATVSRVRLDASATKSWSSQHSGAGWLEPANRVEARCDRDEYPPAYLLTPNDPAFLFAGQNTQGQSVRYLPRDENSGAGQIWKNACFSPPVKDLSDTDFKSKVNGASNAQKAVVNAGTLIQTFAAVTVTARPEFGFGSWDHASNPPPNDGLDANPCWPQAIAALDPGFNLLTFDGFYQGQTPTYNYRAAYTQGPNGS